MTIQVALCHFSALLSPFLWRKDYSFHHILNVHSFTQSFFAFAMTSLSLWPQANLDNKSPSSRLALLSAYEERSENHEDTGEAREASDQLRTILHPLVVWSVSMSPCAVHSTQAPSPQSQVPFPFQRPTGPTQGECEGGCGGAARS